MTLSNYLSFVPAIVVGLAALAFGLVLLRDILRNEPGPIISYELTMAERAIRRFNRRLDTMSKRYGDGHE